jgi:glycerol 2-dehydrogenase (NADP+)
MSLSDSPRCYSQTNISQTVPAVNQIELHPCNPSPKLVDYCKQKGIHATAYSCLGSTDSPLYKNKDLLAIAEAKGKTPQQALLLWNLQLGRSVIPKSVTPKRIEANFQLDGWSLTDDEVSKISAISDRFKVCDGLFLPENAQPIYDGKDE